MDVAPAGRRQRLRELEHRSRLIHAQMLDELAALDREWPDDPCLPDLSCEVARDLGWSQGVAADRIRTATALRELPHLRAAAGAGALSEQQIRWVSRFATPETDAEWTKRAPAMTPNQLKLEYERQCRARREEADSQHAFRYFLAAWDERRTSLYLEGRLGAEQGARVEAAVREAAKAIEADPDAEDPPAARNADALVGLVTSAEGGTTKPSVVVHTDVETLTGTHDGTRRLAETSAGIQLTPDAVRRIGCMARVRAAVERDGDLVGLVHASRGPTEAQMEALWFRDRHCTFPGCEARRFVEAHHVRHWADGGRTTLENLSLLCGRHHRMLHEGGWTIRGKPPDLEFVDRWGEVRTRAGPELARAG